MSNLFFDVIILGFGVSGISLAAQCESNNLNYIVLEKNPNLGGVWFETTKETYLQTHKKFYEFSDFPYPKNTSDHPDKITILNYLKDYIEFKGVNIKKRIFWDSIVKKVYHKNNLWKVNANNITYISRYIGVCLGCFSYPKKIKTNNKSQNINYYEFNKLKNSMKPENLLSIFENKKVIIHGNGPTACDIVDILKNANQIDLTLSIKSPKFYVNKYVFGVSTSKLVHPIILNIIKYFPPLLFYILFSLLEMFMVIIFRKNIKTFVPYSKMNSKNVVGKTILNYKELKLAHYFGEWEENLYDINIWATGSMSPIFSIFPEYDNKNYLFIYNPKYINCGFIGLSPSYNWLQLSEKQSKIFVENIVNNIYPKKTTMINWIKNREKYSKKIGLEYNDLTYDGIGLSKYL
jgi:hypothetical protein